MQNPVTNTCLRIVLTAGAMMAWAMGATGQESTFPVNGTMEKPAVRRVLDHVIVHVSPTEVISDGMVVLHGGQIEYVGPSGSHTVSGPARVENLAGAHVYASFIELESDWGMPGPTERKRERGPQDLSDKKGAFGWNEAVRPEVSAAELFDPTSSSAKEGHEGMLRAGFGAAVVHQADGIVRGSGALVAVGVADPRKALLIPEVSRHFSLRKGSSSQDYPRSLMGAIALLKQTHLDAKWWSAQRAAGLQVEMNLSLEAYAEQQHLPTFCHAGNIQDAYRAQEIQRELRGEHEPWIVTAGGDAYQQIESFDPSTTRWVLSLDFPEPFDVSDPYLSRMIGLDEMKHWELAASNPAMVFQAGFEFALTSSGLENVGKLFLPAVRKAISAGLPEEEALRALTTRPAKWIGAQDRLGQVKTGFDAHLMVLDRPIFDAEAVLYEHIVGEESKIFEDWNAVELQGTYEVTMAGALGTMNVEKAGSGRWKANFKWPEDSVGAPIVLEVEGRQLTLGLQIDTLGQTGKARLWGNVWLDSRIWEGTGELPDGELVAWSAIRLAGDSNSETAGKQVTPDSVPQPAGSVIHPFVAYGNMEQPKAETLWIQNATVWTCGPEGTLEGADVIIHQGKIVAVGSGLDLASVFGTKSNIQPTIFDGRGMHITPGIIDEHSHIAVSRGINEGTQASSAEVEIGSALNNRDVNIYRQLAGGVTTAQLLHGSANPIGGQSALIKLRWGEDPAGMLFEDAPGFIKFALGENVKQSNWGDDYRSRFPQTRMGVEQVYYDMFIRAREYKARWMDYERNMQNRRLRDRIRGIEITGPRRDLELETLAEILDGTRQITCHSYRQDEINMLMHVADSMGFKINTFTHILEGYKVADKMAEHGAGGSTFSDWWAYKYEVKDAIPYNGAVLHGQGVVTAFNSDDDEMARRLNQEAAKAVKYGGVSEEDALRFVTLNPAILLGIEDRVGSLEVGKDADFVIWNDHPLSVSAIAQQTFIDGRRYFDREEDQAKRDWMQFERARLIQAMGSQSGAGSKRQPTERLRPDYHCETLTDENR